MSADPALSDAPRPLPEGTTSVLQGSTFALSDERGDVHPGTVWGVFHQDTRVLSEFALEVDGRRPSLLSSGKTAPHAARFFSAVRDARSGGLSIRRRRIVSDHVLEDVSIQSHRRRDSRVTVRIRVGADFADLFEVKTSADDVSYGEIDADPDAASSIRFRNTRPGIDVWTKVSFSEPPAIDGDTATYVVDLPAGGTWNTRIRVSWRDWMGANGSSSDEDGLDRLDEPERRAADEFERWVAAFPSLRASSDTLVHMYRRSIADLAALRLPMDVGGEEVVLPAAGLPWFMTIFGRDTLITAYEALPFAPALAEGALRALASLQGERVDDRRDEEPGKVLHEIRSGPLTVSGALPFDPYYGSVDATPLWLVVLSEYERWTGDADLVDRLWPNATRALDWIDANLTRSRSGYLEYETRSPTGLSNQGWKDSWDAIAFRDGALAAPPIALVEVQGYVFDAWNRTAELAGRVLGDRALERDLRERAAELARRFQADFWLEDRGGFYALGLDGEDRRIDSLTSNIGHLLWSGLVPEDRVAAIVERLFAPELWSGWGIRTLSTSDTGFDPVGYHIGSIWPHDNALIADGLGRAGRWGEARRIAEAMVAASSYLDSRLPEAFAGYDRSESLFPVRYPTASSPQAWATASTFVWIRMMLGLRADDTLRWSRGDDDGRWIHLHDVTYRGTRHDIHVPAGSERDGSR